MGPQRFALKTATMGTQRFALKTARMGPQRFALKTIGKVSRERSAGV